MDSIKNRTDKIPKPDVKVDYPWHEVEARPINKNLDVKKYYPYHIALGVEDTDLLTISDVVVGVINSLYEPLSNIFIELRSVTDDSNIYSGTTNDAGLLNLSYIANDTYIVSIYKDDVLEIQYFDIRFDEVKQQYFKCDIDTTRIYDGMYGSTDSQLYDNVVDGMYGSTDSQLYDNVIDGGNALQV